MSKNHEILHQVTRINQILLREAIYRGDKEAVKRLLDKDSDINIQPSLLIKAVEDGQKEIVDMFIKNHFDININVREGFYYITPLMQAVKHNKLEVVTLFLNAEAKVNAQDSFGYTALMQATVYCYKEIVEILLQYGADPSILNNNNNNALDIAKSIAKDKCGCEEIIKLLENSLNLGSGIKKFVELLPDKPNIVSEEELSKELVGEEYANYDYLLCCIIS